jgi:hypothetical protein
LVTLPVVLCAQRERLKLRFESEVFTFAGPNALQISNAPDEPAAFGAIHMIAQLHDRLG